MTPGDTARVLALITSLDKRTVGDTDVQAWHLVIGHLDANDCAQAVRDHFTETTDYLMPVHVIRRAETIARQRAGHQRRLELDAQIEADTRAITDSPTQPFDHDTFRNQLKALTANSHTVPRVDPRPDHARMAEARAEVAAHTEQPADGTKERSRQVTENVEASRG